MSPSPKPPAAPDMRDPRLDFFRGVGMFIILFAHIPDGWWVEWIPARFGFSDAADLFVFCSGMASAIAFGRIFIDFGWFNGAARIVHRMWQVYWAHIGCFLATLAVFLSVDASLAEPAYLANGTALSYLFQDPRHALLEFLTLTWAPPYFDILPMYIVILGMIPVVMALARIHLALVAAFVATLWIGANFLGWTITGDRVGGYGWYFNPFGWQLVFFTGFAFMRGWLPAPPRDARLLAAMIAFCVVCAPFSCHEGFSCYAGWGYAPALGEAHNWLAPHIDKNSYGWLHYVHFMATAYIAWFAVGVRGANLHGKAIDLMRKVGQQTLAVFLVGTVASQALGIYLDFAGRNLYTTAIANIAGAAVLAAAAVVVTWIKTPPWRKKPQAVSIRAAPVQSPEAADSRPGVEGAAPSHA